MRLTTTVCDHSAQIVVRVPDLIWDKNGFSSHRIKPYTPGSNVSVCYGSTVLLMTKDSDLTWYFDTFTQTLVVILYFRLGLNSARSINDST